MLCQVKVTLRLTVGQSVSRSWSRAPSGAHDQIFNTLWQLRSCIYGAPCLTRGRVCLLYILLVLASAVFLGSESPGIGNHILLSQIWDFPYCRLLRLAGWRWRYSTPPPHRYFLAMLWPSTLQCKESVRTSQETRHISATKFNWLFCLGKQSLLTVRTIRITQIHSVGRLQSLNMLNQVGLKLLIALAVWRPVSVSKPYWILTASWCIINMQDEEFYLLGHSARSKPNKKPTRSIHEAEPNEGLALLTASSLLVVSTA
jgi:hypothetical protein